jgi:hypothetical protein
MTFDRWCQWLFYASLLLVGFGFAVAVAPNLGWLGTWSARVDANFFPDRVHPNAVAERSFLMAILGASIAGMYILQAFVVAFPFRNREAWAWYAIAGSNLAWFALDSGLSALHGFTFNIYTVNLFPLFILGIPLAATWSAFSRPRA